MSQEEMMQMEINNEIEKNGNYFFLYEERNENEYRRDLIDEIEKITCVQQKSTDIGSQWKRLNNKCSLNLSNIKYISLLLNNLVKHIKNILFFGINYIPFT